MFHLLFNSTSCVRVEFVRGILIVNVLIQKWIPRNLTAVEEIVLLLFIIIVLLLLFFLVLGLIFMVLCKIFPEDKNGGRNILVLVIPINLVMLFFSYVEFGHSAPWWYHLIGVLGFDLVFLIVGLFIMREEDKRTETLEEETEDEGRNK